MPVTVFGTYLNPDGSPGVGAVRFTLVPAAVSETGMQYTEGPIVCTLDDTGSFRAKLVPDPVLVTNGWAGYVVNERVVGLMRTWKLVLDGTLDSINVPAFYPGPQVELGAVKPFPGGPPGLQGEVAVESTVTLPPGTPAYVEDLDLSPHRALLRFGIPQGAPGTGGGGGGPANRFTFTQAVPAKVWTVAHSLGCHPAVTVEDGGGTFIHGTVDYVDDNTLTVGFAYPLTGRVNCV